MISPDLLNICELYTQIFVIFNKKYIYYKVEVFLFAFSSIYNTVISERKIPIFMNEG